MAGQKLLDLETNLANAERASGCNALFTAYQAGLDDWSSMSVHLRSGVSKGEHSALYSGLESARKRLVKLDGRIRKCFCTK